MNKKMIISFILLGACAVVSLFEMFLFQSIWMLVVSIALLLASIVFFVIGIVSLKNAKNNKKEE